MNPYLIEPPALISFSGGRTSGFMLRQILDAHGGTLPDGIHVTFANTGKERSETLDFVHEIETRWCPVAWLEYRYLPPGNSPEPSVVDALREALLDEFEVTATQSGTHSYATVNYQTASRNGEPFAELIRLKKFLPNPVMRFCTTELKVRVMKKYMLDQGYEYWDVAIGLRADEMGRVHRASLSCARERWTNIMPMAKAEHGLADVMAFWKSQPFDLQLRQDEGNCDLCFLKASHKIERLILENPRSVDWWDAQEKACAGTFRKDRPSYANLLKIVTEQGRFGFDDHCYDTCNCTD